MWSVDLFRCESAVLKSYWILLVLDPRTRRIIGFGVHTSPIDARLLCSMFNAALAGQPKPVRLSSDHDPLFRSHRWQANLRVLEIEEVKTVPGVPLSHPFVERAIGTIRREFLDHTLFWNSIDLQRKLHSFRRYYNDHRVHSGIGGRTPSDVADDRAPRHAKLSDSQWASHCGGIVQLPEAA